MKMSRTARYYFSPARQEGSWWLIDIRDDTERGRIVSTIRATVETSAIRDAREWIRTAENQE
jgi:hypothetical protein